MLIYGEDREPPAWFNYLSIAIGTSVCIGQGLIVAGAVSLALYHDLSRWDWLWYLAGFLWSSPITLVKNVNNPDDKFAGLGILLSGIAYVVACISPVVIPYFLLMVSRILAI